MFGTIGPGRFEIKVQYLNSVDPWAYEVAPGATAERLSRFSVFARLADQTNVPGVSVDVFPERGPNYSCITNNSGYCDGWVLIGPVRVSANKSGFRPSEGTVSLPWDNFGKSIVVTMIPQ